MKQDLTKTRVENEVFECIHCEKFFECTGRPEGVKRCLNFSERRDKSVRTANVCESNYRQ